jgi:predicted ATPase/DNA-binding SARP family transcriptional activator
MSDADAKNNLRQALTNLRRIADDCLTITRDSIEFTGDCFLDSSKFELNVKTASSLDPMPASVILTDSFNLYRGDFLEGIFVRDAPNFEDWALVERARLRELALQCLHTLTQFHNEHGNYTEAMIYASRLLAFDPWREEAHRQRMLALVRAGQRSAALAQYQTCRRILDKELGVEPSSETTALYEQIRTAENLSLHNLPASATSFIGRESELAEITVRLLDANCRVLTLVGEGGVGKTRLALQAAQAHVNQFLGGVWIIPLSSVKELDGLLALIARTIKFDGSGGGSLEVGLRQYLQDKNILLILDGMEHLIDPAILAWITETLHYSPHLKFLVTSLERLNILAENLLEIHGLIYKTRIPEEVGLSLLTDPAPRLFLERARRLKPDFNPLKEDAIAVARLCQLVDGIPLALELAASWIRGLTVPDIVKEIERNLDILTTTQQDLPQRHRSMRAVFEHFWQLLSPEEQVVFQKQAVFRDGYTREAFQEVTGADLSMLSRFVDKSAIHFSEDGHYRRHPLMAKFSAMRLANDPVLEAESRECHAHYFGQYVKRLEREFFGGQPQKALTPLLAELNNIRRAWDWAVEHQDSSIFNEMGDSIMQAFDLSGLYHDAREMAVKANESLTLLPEPVSQDVTIAKGRVMGILGAFLFRMGEYEQAMDCCQKSMQTLEKVRPHIAYAHTLVYTGCASFGLGNLEQVIFYWQKAGEEYRAVNSKWGDMTATSNLAEAFIATGKFAKAKSCAEYALALARDTNNLEMIGGSSTNLASIAMREEKYTEATQFAEEALRSHQQVGHDAHIANSLAVLAQIAFCQKNLDEARRLFEESIGILKRVGNHLYLEQRTQELNEVLSAQNQ